MTSMMPVFTIVFVVARRCLTRRQNLTPGLAGPAFTRQWPKPQLKNPKITAFSCGVPRCIAVLVMRILVMCFQMGRSQLGFVIASIRLHLIFKATNEQKFSPRSVRPERALAGVDGWRRPRKTPLSSGSINWPAQLRLVASYEVSAVFWRSL